MTVPVLPISFEARDLPRLLTDVVTTFCSGRAPDAIVQIDSDLDLALVDDWPERYAHQEIEVTFGSSVLQTDPEDRAVIAELDLPLDLEALLTSLERIDFETAVVGALHEEWLGRAGDPSWGMSGAGLGFGHHPHGFLTAFKGDGHRRLMSKRAVDYGPWRVIRRGDLTALQFHAVDADPATARAQALPAHRWLGYKVQDPGVILFGEHHVYHHDLRGFYDAETRTYRILVAGRPVPLQEMNDARELMEKRRRDGDEVIDRLAFVFAYEAEARAHLHELWLRGLECRVTTPSADEVQLDASYTPPPPTPPEWVARLESNEGAG